MRAICDRSPFAPCPASFNMAAHVLGSATARPDKVALAVLGPTRAERWSHARLEAAVRGTATGLLRAGLGPGDRVLMRLGNDVAFPISYLGAIAADIVPVPTSAQLTAREVAALIDMVAPAAILCAPGIACPDTRLPVIEQDKLAEMRALPPAEYALGDPDRPAYIVFTSGTSGQPRAVCHAHRAIWARRMMYDGWYGLRADDRLCHAGAFNWTYTLGTGLMDPWAMGATALIAAEDTRIEQLPLLLRRHDATIFAAAPGVYRKLLAGAPQLDLPRLRHGLAAGEKLSEHLRAAWRAATGTDLHEAYGMSECSTFVSGCPADPAPAGTLGRPQPGRRVAIVDADGAVQPVGAEGTIAVDRRDPGLMLGYPGAEAEAAARMAGDWFLTGDQGIMDGDGHITYLGRADDMMNAGGYRVSPLEVEAALADHPGIAQCAVTDIEVKRDARVIVAFYTGPAALPEAELGGFAAGRLAAYKQPRAWLHVTELPTGANGKIRRRALRPIWETRHGWTREADA